MNLSEDRPTPFLPSHSYLLGLGKGLGCNMDFSLDERERVRLRFSHKSTFQFGMISRHHLLQGFTQIMDEMPAISNLKSLRSTTGGSISKGSATITADDFNTGVLLEPCSKGLRGSILKQINWGLLLQIH